MVSAVHDFFSGGVLPREFTSSFLVLIPKVDNPKGFDKFRPISLCSVFYKVGTKILVSRLSPLFSRFISEEQGAFILSRSIFENVSLTQELIRSIHKPTRGGNVILKIDMAKAYDSVDWGFLLHVMTAFGFSTSIYNLVRQCISSPWYSVMMNGVSKGFFQGTQGMRQEDPISPYLFVMVEEILSRVLDKNYREGLVRAFSHPQGVPIISHLLYADDIVIFSNGSKSSLKVISNYLALYERWSRQKVSKEKSSLIFSKHISYARRRQLLRLIGFSKAVFPFKYLRVPVVSGRIKAVHFDELIGGYKRE